MHERKFSLSSLLSPSLSLSLLFSLQFLWSRSRHFLRNAATLLSTTIRRCNRLGWMNGSTAVTAVVADGKLFVGNIGDSEACLVSLEYVTLTTFAITFFLVCIYYCWSILLPLLFVVEVLCCGALLCSEKGELATMNLTTPHKASDPSEKERIEGLGGHVFFGTRHISSSTHFLIHQAECSVPSLFREPSEIRDINNRKRHKVSTTSILFFLYHRHWLVFYLTDRFCYCRTSAD